MTNGTTHHRKPAGLRWVLVLCLLLPMQVMVGQAATPEYTLKAALLFKLSNFVEWPARQRATAAFSLCVLGDDVFDDALQQLSGRKVRQRPVRVEYFDHSDAIGAPCHILFITESKQPFIDDILGQLEHPGTLTVSDIEDFADQGGMIEFTYAERKIGFRINLQAARDAGLSIAAPLLELSSVTTSSRDGDHP